MTSVPVQDQARVRVRLGDLGLAPENLRFNEPADDGVPRLADTVRAAGLIYPPIVRKGRKGERPFMVLDGRRRRFALLLQVERGERTLDDEIDCVLADGKAAQAAAVVLTATELAPVHLADVIAAIGKLRRSRLETPAIAAALGYDELEIKRLEALAQVHPTVLEAFRTGDLTLRQVRLFARLGDRKRQKELAEAAREGYAPDYQLQTLLRQDRVTVETAEMALVGRTAYAAAGGRFAADLFDEFPDVVLDPGILTDLWRARAQQLVGALEGLGLMVTLGEDAGYGGPDGLHRMPYVYERLLPESHREGYRTAQAGVETAAAAFTDLDLASDEAMPAIAGWLAAKHALASASLVGGAVEAVLLHPSPQSGVGAVFFWRQTAVEADPEADVEGEEDEGETVTAGPDIPDAEPVAVEVEGIGHGLHAVRTDVATRGLVRDLADHPGAAFTALIAQLFKRLALHDRVPSGESALTISATAYGPARGAIQPLDGEVRERLARRREAFLASGLRPIAWVDRLPEADRFGLMAELVAISLDLHEARTSSIRRGARAEAAEIAGLCGSDIARHWTPDAAFLGVHSKPQLLAMLDDLDAGTSTAKALRKGELIDVVAATAAKRGWSPPVLQWRPPAAKADEPTEADAAEGAAETVEAAEAA